MQVRRVLRRVLRRALRQALRRLASWSPSCVAACTCRQRSASTCRSSLLLHEAPHIAPNWIIWNRAKPADAAGASRRLTFPSFLELMTTRINRSLALSSAFRAQGGPILALADLKMRQLPSSCGATSVALRNSPVLQATDAVSEAGGRVCRVQLARTGASSQLDIWGPIGGGLGSGQSILAPNSICCLGGGGESLFRSATRELPDLRRLIRRRRVAMTIRLT